MINFPTSPTNGQQITAALIYWPVTVPWVQWMNLALFVGVVVNNLMVLRKLKGQK